MIDVVVWETVTGRQELHVPWRHCFLSGNIADGAYFGCLGPHFIAFL
jgi:hypothetical protein